MSRIKLIIIIILLLSTAFISYVALAEQFTWTQQDDPGVKNWQEITSSEDGTKLAACIDGGHIWTGVYSGGTWTWTERAVDDNRQWYGITGSADGTKLAACVYDGYIYTSTDSGATWTPRANDQNRQWYAITCSADGTKLAASNNGGYIYTSTDSGATWIPQTNSGVKAWFPGLVSSADGTKLVAAVQNEYIYTSADSGVTWTQQTVPGIKAWGEIAGSSDGTNLFCAIFNTGKIWKSIDSGEHWTELSNAGTKDWRGLVSSTDGTRLSACANNDFVWTSSDAGGTWTQQSDPVQDDWYCMASSADGTRLAAAVYGGYIFAGISSAPAILTTSISIITAVSASSGGNTISQGGSAVTAKGVCWSTGYYPTTSDSYTSDGSGTANFTSSITGLSPGTTYHVRAYATNTTGTAYGDDVEFTTLSIAPTVTTTSPSSITSNTASSGGNVTSDGGDTVTARGVCWSTAENPTTVDDFTTDGSGTGSYTSSITGLNPGTTYHIRAYATNSVGTSYGADITFTTIASTWYFAEGSTQNGFETWILVLNPNDTSAEIVYTFYWTDGINTGSVIYPSAGIVTIPADTRSTINVNTLSQQSEYIILQNKAISIKVEATNNKNIIAERAMYWDKNSSPGRGGHCSIGTIQPSTIWYLAEGCTAGFNEWLLIFNTSGSQAACTLTFMDDRGTVTTKEVSVSGESRITLLLNQYPEISNKSFSIKIEADQDIVVERSMYWDAGGGHCSIGKTNSATTCYLAEGSTGGFDTWVLIQNPNATAATVTATFMKSNGTTVSMNPTNYDSGDPNYGKIRPYSRCTVYVNNVVPNESVSTKIVSDLSIVAERSMYWDAGGVRWSGGHCGYGIESGSQSWYFSEGAIGSSAQFSDWLLLQNPNGSETTCVITFFDSNGNEIIESSFTISATSRKTINVGALYPEMVNKSFGCKVTSTENIAVERAMYWDAQGIEWIEGHCSAGYVS